MHLNGRNLILSISGGNVFTSFGGTEKVIISHQHMFNANNIAYLYLYPVSKQWRNQELYRYWGMVFDGKFYGLYTTEQVVRIISNLISHDGGLLKIHIHHLKNVVMKELEHILDEFLDVEIFFYGHDYYLICEEYTLRNDEGKYCGEGLPCKQKCGDCNKYKFSHKAQQRRQLVDKYRDRMRLIVPSDAPAKIFRESIPDWSEKIQIVYHQRQEGVYMGNRTPIPEKTKIKVAFCGLPSEIKGWNSWIDAVDSAVAQHSNIEFYHMGKSTKKHAHVMNVSVGFKTNELTMTEALRQHNIDCVVLWSQCPETYSYVYYECLAANTFVITSRCSGNIAEQVKRNRTGIVLENDEQLRILLSDSSKLAQLINEMRENVPCGPSILVENEEIVQLSKGEGYRVSQITNKSKGTIKKHIIETLYIWSLKRKNPTCKFGGKYD